MSREDLSQLVEELSLHWERHGMPRIAGRIVGWLLVCDPPHQSMEELGRAISASKASLSTMTRLLEQMQLVERVAVPGRREALFRIAPGAWLRSEEAQIASIRTFRQLAERGLALLADAPAERRARLRDMRENYLFWERELPRVVEKLRKKERKR